jgi:hypothetical protein
MACMRAFLRLFICRTYEAAHHRTVILSYVMHGMGWGAWWEWLALIWDSAKNCDAGLDIACLLTFVCTERMKTRGLFLE